MNDSTTPWSFDIAYPVSQTSFDTAYALIVKDQLSLPFYTVTSFNCVDFIKSVAAAANIKLPNTNYTPNISDPLSFGLALQSIGNGNSEYGGTVSFNSAVSSPSIVLKAASSGATTPYDYS